MFVISSRLIFPLSEYEPLLFLLCPFLLALHQLPLVFLACYTSELFLTFSLTSVTWFSAAVSISVCLSLLKHSPVIQQRMELSFWLMTVKKHEIKYSNLRVNVVNRKKSHHRTFSFECNVSYCPSLPLDFFSLETSVFFLGFFL